MTSHDYNAIDHLPEAYQEASLPAWAAAILLPGKKFRLGPIPGEKDSPKDAWATHRVSLEWEHVTETISWEGEAGDSFEQEALSSIEISSFEARRAVGSFERVGGVCRSLGIPLDASLRLPGEDPQFLQVRPGKSLANLSSASARDEEVPSIPLEKALRLGDSSESLEELREALAAMLSERIASEPLGSAHSRFLSLWGEGDPEAGLSRAREALSNCQSILEAPWPESWLSSSSPKALPPESLAACSARAPDGELLLSKLLAQCVLYAKGVRSCALATPLPERIPLLEASLSQALPGFRDRESFAASLAFWESCAEAAAHPSCPDSFRRALVSELPLARKSLAASLPSEPVSSTRWRPSPEDFSRAERALLGCESAILSPQAPSKGPRSGL